MKVYLAGGFKSNWQDEVKKITKHTYFDPKVDSRQGAIYKFALDDIEGLKTCNLVFAYFELDNPSGLGLAQEIGIATILEIPVWYIDEHERLNSFLCACSQRIYSNFNCAIKDLVNYGS